MRKIRGLFMAVLAVGALAVTPAVASATDGLFMVPGTPEVPAGDATFEAAKYPASITGEKYVNGQYQGEIVLLDGGAWQVSCPAASLSSQLTAAAQALTLQASYSGECLMGTEEQIGAKVSMNGCRYVYAETGQTSVDIFEASAEIVCDAGKAIKLEGPGCTISVPAQELGKAELSNDRVDGKDVVLAAMIGSGLEYSASGWFCSIVGVPTGTTYANGTSISHMTLRGFSVVPGTPAVPATNPTIEAAQYPSNVTGERYANGSQQGEIVLLDGGAWDVSCSAASLSGQLSGAAQALTLQASYPGECSMGTEEQLGTPVSMNGCRYVYSGFEAGATEGLYLAAAEIVCDAGKAISIGGLGCTITIPAQSLGAKTELDNETIGGQKVVLAAMFGSGLEYSASGGFCSFAGVPTGTYANGTSISHMTLRGKAV